jgi:F-type H+-transporting ATPase subunit epsilon
MDQKLLLRIVTPDREVLREEVDEVQIPGKEGYLGILPGHAPLISEMDIGEISFKQGSKQDHLAVHRGFVEVLPTQVTILAESAERRADINVERARAAKERAERRLKSPDADIDLNRASVALQRALIRLQVGSRGM